MPNPKRLWTDYPEQYLVLAKSVATAAIPALYGPFPRAEATAFRRNFYRFREALRASVTGTDSYPDRLYDQIAILAIKIEPSNNDPSLYNVIFDLDPVVAEVDKRIDPAAAQMQTLARAHFAAAQRPPAISSPIFSDEEMRERLDEMGDKHDRAKRQR